MAGSAAPRFQNVLSLARITVRTFTALCLFSLSQAQASTDEVGADAGSFSVGNSGSGAWSVPIETPPGIRGMVPNLTAGLSTSSGNGLLGQGGSLSGLSAIARCTKSIAIDGVNSKINFNTAAQYCLDGNRLMLISGTQGAENSEYRTELESFQKIVANGSAGSAGPASFTVTSRSGSTMTFGGSNNASILHHSGAVVNWRISRLEDTSSNYMDYFYASDPSESLLDEIHYGGNINAAQAHFLKVKLVYEDRPDQFSTYGFGTLGQSTQRLAAIQTYADEIMVRDYQLSYELSEVSNQSRLSQFQECALGDDGIVCLAPTTFAFTPEDNAWQVSSTTIPAATQGAQGQPYGLNIDINNDGWSDWIVSVRHENGSIENQTRLGSASGFTTHASWTLPTVLYNYQLHTDGMGTAQLVDINGDGYVDVIEAYQTASGTVQNVWLNTGLGFATTSQFALPDVFVSTVNLDRGELRLRFTELNGDGLADAVVYTRDRTNATTRKAWINNGTAWVEANQWLPEQPLSDYSDTSFPAEREYATLADINGDGLADYIQATYNSPTSNTKKVWLNDGNGWTLDTNYAPPIELIDYATHKRGHPKGRLVDLNGDGLLDIAYAITLLDSSTVSDAWLNTGEGWLNAPTWALPASMVSYQADGYTDMLGAMMDLNGDGKPEYIHSYKDSSNATHFTAWEHDGSAWQSSGLAALPLPLYQHHVGANSTAYAQIGDINTDGIADVYSAISGITNTVHTHATPASGTVAGTLASITNGLGVQTHITYANSNDPAVYTPASLSPWPDIASNANRVLIQSSKISNGLGRWNEAFHQYAEARINVTGRGGLGFASHSAADGRSGIVITSEFHQGFPYTGMVKSSSNKTSTNIALSDSSSTPAQRSLNGGKTTYAYVDSSTSHDYDLLSGNWIQTKQLSSINDDYGNTTQTAEIITNSEGEQLTKVRDTTPTLDLANWILNKTSISTQTISQPGKPSHTTTVHNTEYYPNSNLLKTEVLEPGHAHSLTSTYEYDVFGNRTKTTIASSTAQTPPLSPRVTTSNFINPTGRKDGRFPLSVTNTLGHTASSQYDGRYGKPANSFDANGVEKAYYYNAFGVQLNETIVRDNDPEPDGKEVAIPHWCLAQHNCPPNAVYFVAALDNQREAPESAYYDVYGREIRRQTHGMGGAVIYQDTEYDAYGRKWRVSNHYFKDQTAAVSWKTTTYDILDRPKTVTLPDGGVTTFDYDGLTSTTTNALTQSNSVDKNILGKAKLSTDADSNSTSFDYDVRGNLLSTTDTDGHQIINTYDHFGRKETMSDPDMGDWVYTYDAFGQMRTQTDANLEVVTLDYDELGRTKTRDEREGQTIWNYDTATNGIGRLNSVSSPIYTRTLEYDSLGRTDKSTVDTNGKSFVTEFGFQGVAGKVDWVQYPTGLVVHKSYDDYGFPTELESINLANYQAYRNKLDEANDHYKEALILQAQTQDEYDALKEVVEPYYEAINTARDAAQPWLTLQNKAAGKEVQHNNLVVDYYAEYTLSATPYNQHITAANNYIAYAEAANSVGDAAWTIAVGHYWSAQGYLADANWYYNNGTQAQYDAAMALYDSKIGIYYSQASTASTQWGIANTAYNNASTEQGLAAPYEEKVSIYGAILSSHQNIQAGFAARRGGYEDQSAPYFGRWAARSDPNTNCIAWSQDDPESDFCVTELGNYQTEWNGLAATGTEDRYKEILEAIEAEVELGDTAKAEADGLYDTYKNSSTVYWTALDADADGQITQAQYGNGVESTWTYDEMGRSATINTITPYTDTIQTNAQVQNELYDFDALGNLEYRHDLTYDFREDFDYDTLNRLTKSEVSGVGASLYAAVGLTTIDMSYDALGNITNKSDVTGTNTGIHYAYGANNAGPHAVTSIGGTKNTTFSYDNNGNQLSGNGRSIIDYTSFNKPSHIVKGANISDMQYGPGRELIKQIEITSGETTTTTYIGGLYEELEKNGTTKAKHHLTIAGQTVAVINHDVLGTPSSPSYAYDDTHYLHRDHLNSITAITDQEGKLVEQFHYDAFGQRRTAVQAPFANFAAAGFFPITSRGYTGHKQMSGTDLIHMGGRVYDPEVGRFLSADPHIQSPLNTQSLNRYSYVNNNPLSFTDPSGYFFKKLFKSIKKVFKKIVKVIQKVVKAVVKAIRAVVRVVKKVIKKIKKYIKPLLAVAIAIMAPYAVAAYLGTTVAALSAGAALAAGAIGGGLAGLVTTGTLKGMLIGAISGAAFAGIGNHFAGKIAANVRSGVATLKNGLSAAQQAGKVLMHGAAGGLRSVLSGGNFRTGFVAAGFAQLAAPVIDNIDSSTGQVFAAGVAGGVGSELVGGSFEDGFVTGVFSRAFNDNLGHKRQNGQIQTDKSRVEDFKEVGEWQTEAAVGDVPAHIMQGAPIFVVKAAGYALDAADVLSVQSRSVTTGQVRVTDSYTHNTLYDTTNPNPENWTEIPGFRSEGVVSHSRTEPIWSNTTVQNRACISGGAGCSIAW